MLPFFDHQIDSLSTDEFDIGTRRVKVRVVGDDVTLLAGHPEKDALGGASLMCGDDVLVAKNVLNGIFEVIEALASSVAFVAFHDGSPLMRGHGSGAGIGEEVD